MSTGLTPRQREIAEFVAEGRSNVDIAAALSISRRTVETDRENIEIRLGLRSRQELVAWALPDPPTVRPADRPTPTVRRPLIQVPPVQADRRDDG